MKTNFTLIHLAALLIGLACLNSCSVMLYAPNSENVPLFTEKNEARIAANYIFQANSFSDVDGGEIQVAYAVTHHLGIMSNLFFSGATEDGESLKGGLFEAGTGYFNAFGKHGVFETYGGAGIGWLNHSGAGSNNSVHGERLFVQPAIGFTSKPFDVAFSIRGCAISFNDPSDKNADQKYVQEIEDNKFSLLAEPALTLRGGWEYVKLQLQVGASYNFTHPEFDQSNGYVSIGIFISLSPKYKIKQQ